MTITYEVVRDLIYREGYLLDGGKFEEWLELYAEDAECWVPAWGDDLNEQTQDPQKEISLIYYSNRDGLADRIFRLQTGKSAASMPLFRTSHIAGNIVLEEVGENDCVASCAWVTHSYREGKSLVYFGNSRYVLKRSGGSLRISSKRVDLKNDRIDQVLDVYQI